LAFYVQTWVIGVKPWCPIAHLSWRTWHVHDKTSYKLHRLFLFTPLIYSSTNCIYNPSNYTRDCGATCKHTRL